MTKNNTETIKYHPKNHIRVVTATSLFDGHDASINIFRRIMQDSGVEVIHLGHNRSVEEIVSSAIDEDVQGIALSSYQGGHIEFFKYIIDTLKERDASHIKIFAGGGGVIVPEEIKELEEYGVTKIYTPDDGRKHGLQGIINHLIENIDFPVSKNSADEITISKNNPRSIAQMITIIEEADKNNSDKIMEKVHSKTDKKITPVIGITGTGGAGKSSLIDDLILRFSHDNPEIHIAILSCDPSRKKTGGALLGDRIRMNAIFNPKIYMRSLATRNSEKEISDSLANAIDIVKAADFDLIIAETAGSGQADSHITDLADISVYVMTGEFGAASQLEKIAMLDYADIVVINKFEKSGSEDAFRDVRKQYQRNSGEFGKSPDEMPVFGTIASKFNDDGVTSLYNYLNILIKEKTKVEFNSVNKKINSKKSSSKAIIIPAERTRYLSDISETVRKYHHYTEEESERARMLWHLEESKNLLKKKNNTDIIEKEYKILKESIENDTKEKISTWETLKEKYKNDFLEYNVRDKKIKINIYSESLSGTKIPKVALPRHKDHGDIYTWLRKENVPGSFPYTAGVFPVKRIDEDPTRMFAGEGGPARTNERFKLLSENYEAKRLSTAFDSITLYGCDPDFRPDIYGKIGISGVSICTLDDIKQLYDGFDLCSPNTSVSMTINGPAPIMLAMFLNTAIDQQVEKFISDKKKKPEGKDFDTIYDYVLKNVRGTVQADILKEDQGQNTCIFSIDFAIKMMGDIQQFFVDNKIRNLYSVSISGYHIAEAGANPITQLAFTLANGFTYIEYYLSRGMNIDDFTGNFSFFFSNGMDPEYTVIGRVARRIWAIALKEKYGASEKSQMLKYHIQTSGRSLHSRDMQFNDIRTTLQALCAISDNCNSLHTNAYDEAITTPSKESARRALAVQQIINQEWGLSKNENSLQGSFIIEELTDLVEEAVLAEFDRITERGGMLGAMERGYQRSKIQDESMLYEHRKQSGELPIIGVNTFLDPDYKEGDLESSIELARSTEEEKISQINRLQDFKKLHSKESIAALNNLQEIALSGENIFAELMKTVRICSLGEITDALYKVGGQYRRNM